MVINDQLWKQQSVLAISRANKSDFMQLRDTFVSLNIILVMKFALITFFILNGI